METKQRTVGFQKYELIGGLCFLALFLSDLLPLVLRRLTFRFVGTSDPLRAGLIINLAFDLVCLAVLLPLLHRWLAGQLRRLRENGLRQTGRQLLAGAGWMLLSLFVLSWLLGFVISMYPDYSNGNQEALERLSGRYPLWMGLMTCVTAPLIEELLFRGLVFSALRPRSRFWAYLLSGLLFALPHVSAYVFDVPTAVSAVNLLLYFTMGLVLARVCERSGSVFTSVLLHALYNTIITLLI